MSERKTAFGPAPVFGVTPPRLTIRDIIENRLPPEWRALLVAAFDRGINRGMGYPARRTTPLMSEILDIIEQDWQADFEAACGQVQGAESPGWLKAYAEREIALGDAEPPIGWQP